MATGRIQNLLLVQFAIKVGSAGTRNYTVTRDMKFVDCSMYGTGNGAGTMTVTQPLGAITSVMNPSFPGPPPDTIMARTSIIRADRTTLTAGTQLGVIVSANTNEGIVNCLFIPPNAPSTTQTLT